MENAQFGCNIWANQKLPAEYMQPASGIAVNKHQWRPVCTSTVSAVRMPPGLALPAASQQQHPVSHLQLPGQADLVPPAVLPNEATWLQCAEPAEELASTARCQTLISNGNPQNLGERDNLISSDQFQQQQQALLLAQVKATLHALQTCPQQSVSADQHSQHASAVSYIPPFSRTPADQSRFDIAYRKPDEPQPAMNLHAQRSIFVNGKDAHALPAGMPNATPNSVSPQLQLQQSSDFPQQQQVPDLSKCMISATHDRETGVTMQTFPVPQQAFMQTLCSELFNNQPSPSTSRSLLPACFQDSGQPFVRSAAVPLNVAPDKMQLEQNSLLVHGSNLRCNQSMWNGNNSQRLAYSQYAVTSNAPAEQYKMVGRLTPVMVGPAGDLFCNSVPSQICTIPSPVMVGSKFPR